MHGRALLALFAAAFFASSCMNPNQPATLQSLSLLHPLRTARSLLSVRRPLHLSQLAAAHSSATGGGAAAASTSPTTAAAAASGEASAAAMPSLPTVRHIPAEKLAVSKPTWWLE